MNYRELKEELVDLGFEEDSIMTDEEYIRKFASASNRAIDYINTTVRPYVKCVTLKSPGVYDLAEEASDFVDFFEKPKFTENGERKTLGRYFIIRNSWSSKGVHLIINTFKLNKILICDVRY